jgi:ATP-dependent Lon protease
MKLMPQFPLQLVVYPGESLNLHIFEPRYRQLINECHKEGMTFGIPSFIDNRVMGIGTEVELISIEKTFDSGEMDVKTQGIGIYKIAKFHDKVLGKSYAGAEVERLEIDDSTDIATANEVLDYLEELYKILDIKRQIPKDVSELNTYDLAHHIGCNIEQEYEILTIPDGYGRLKFIYNHLQNLLPIVQETEMLRKKAQMNGHFKNILPPDF